MKLWKTLGLSAAFLCVAAAGFAGGATYNGFPVVNLAVNGKALKLDVPAIVMDGRTLVPARALAEALGATIHFDEVDNTVLINAQQTPAQQQPPAQPPEKESARDIFDVTQAKGSEGDLGIVTITGYIKNISNHAVTNVSVTGVLLDGNGAVSAKSLPGYIGSLTAGSEAPFELKIFSAPADWVKWDLNVAWRNQ